ncbi:MAG: DUF3575 domain-containing protein [Muribaculaceae bacterium]|nr:DUF3575 domain-containing protein [Muribaculaceae bacterium]
MSLWICLLFLGGLKAHSQATPDLTDLRTQEPAIIVEQAQEPETTQDVEEIEVFEFPTVAPSGMQAPAGLTLKSDILPWGLAIPNIGAEYSFANNWSIALNVLFCPWKISDKFSVKTVAILPEGRWWLKNNRKGSFFNLHLNLAWFNVRSGHYRYQDTSRPLLGAGIGYGYRLEFNNRWGIEFEIGAGVANMKYSRYHNVFNGALIDSRVSTYWGLDRASITFVYYLCDL